MRPCDHSLASRPLVLAKYPMEQAIVMGAGKDAGVSGLPGIDWMAHPSSIAAVFS
jgi:hypothetical protein